jgi:CRP-like cAMP-binding protein
MEKKTYPADIEIIREGMDGTHMYILEKGEVAVTKVNHIQWLTQNRSSFSYSSCWAIFGNS